MIRASVFNVVQWHESVIAKFGDGVLTCGVRGKDEGNSNARNAADTCATGLKLSVSFQPWRWIGR